jgi:hypothetical protein
MRLSQCFVAGLTSPHERPCGLLGTISIIVGNGGDEVSNNMATRQELPQTSDEMLQLLERAKAGDETVTEQVREMLTICPEFAESLGGDLGQITERLLSTAVAGNDIPFRESIKHKMATLRQDLAGPAATPIETLLIDRIVICWLQVQMADIAQAKEESQTITLEKFQLRRQDSANRRYLAAIRTLATIRKMALPVLQINLGQNQVNMAGGTQE